MKEFENALSNYIKDFANGGAIRHFVELGYSVEEIKSSLDFPMSIDDVALYVWKEYIDSKVICLDKDEIDKDYIVKTSFVKDYNKYGKTSLRKVTKKEPIEKKSYISCDFGKKIYKDKEDFNNKLNMLDEDNKSMIENLPWPLEIVYVENSSKLGQAVSAFYNIM